VRRFSCSYSGHVLPLLLLALLFSLLAGCTCAGRYLVGADDAHKDGGREVGHSNRLGGEAGLDALPSDISVIDLALPDIWFSNDVDVALKAEVSDLAGDIPADEEAVSIIDAGCVPACEGKECGPNGCGMTCGTCADDKYCDGGHCALKCGNGLCDYGETCDSCPGECGECACEPGVSSGKKMAGQYGLVWVEVPGGCFMMGCSPGDEDCDGDEKPPHEVTVSPFEILETEVTEAQWAAVFPGDPAPSCDSGGGGGANSPVECISWDEAKVFCEAVDPEGRLCSEAEWEYAARGGTTTKYYCGDDSSCLIDVAWHWGNSGNGPGKHKQDVKGKTPNGYGLYDMLGNVWEWVEDCWHNDYDLNDDGAGDWDVAYPAWTTNCSGSGRVFRGGSFVYEYVYYFVNLRVSNRSGYYDPSYGFFYLGSRCCRSK
jgi:formylglycine-generating enzyme required for sulfatase activity